MAFSQANNTLKALPSLAFTSLENEASSSSSSSPSPSPSPPPSSPLSNQVGSSTNSSPHLRKPVSRSKKAVASVTGAVTTSLLMTPFDVVKTRLQTQTKPEPLFVPSSHLSSAFRVAPISSSSSSASTLPASSSKYGSLNRVSAHPATCCHQTFFTSNRQVESLVCRYDPRRNPSPTAFYAPSTSFPKGSRWSKPSAGSSLSPFGGHSSSYTSSSMPRSSVRILPYPPPAAPNTYLHPSLAANGSSSCACAFPDKVVAAKELKAAAEHHGRLTGLWDGVIKVGKAEGIRGLWRGLSPTLMMTVPSQVTYMTCYDYFRSVLLTNEPCQSLQTRFELEHDKNLGQNPSLLRSLGSAPPHISSHTPSLSAVTAHSLYASLLAGGLARAISATLVTPLELVRTRLQATSRHTSSLSSIFSSLWQQMRTSPGGPLILWRGLSPTLWRDVPFSAIYFAGYETTKRILTGGGLGEGNASGSGEEFGISFISGAISGSIAALFTHPFDLVKTRLQTASPSTSQSINILSKSLRPSSSSSPPVFFTLKQIYLSEGISGLFRGFTPRTAKVAPACGVMIASFEVVGRILAEYD